MYWKHVSVITDVGQGPTVAVSLQSPPSLAASPNKSPNSWSRFPAASAAPRVPCSPEGTPSAASPCPAVLRQRATKGYADAQSKVNLPPNCIASQKKLNLSRHLLGIKLIPLTTTFGKGGMCWVFCAQLFLPPAPLHRATGARVGALAPFKTLLC